jgi:hypothetical protein
MDMDKASMFLSGSILVMLGIVVVIGGLLIINNLIHKFWKPVTLVKWNEPEPVRFMTAEEHSQHHQENK